MLFDLSDERYLFWIEVRTALLACRAALETVGIESGAIPEDVAARSLEEDLLIEACQSVIYAIDHELQQLQMKA